MKEQTSTLALSGVLRMLADRQCLFLTEGLANAFGRVNETFFTIADSSPDAGLQTAYFDAMKMLRAGREPIQEEMVNRVVESFATLATQATKAGAESLDTVQFTERAHSQTPSGDEGGLDNLALVENDELEAIIAIDTMVSVARTNIAAILRPLIGRLATILGSAPDAKSLPFDPECLVNCFDDCSRQMGIGLQPRLSLLALFETTVLVSLPRFLEECDTLLQGMGIKPTYIDDPEKEKEKTREPAPDLDPAEPLPAETVCARKIIGRSSRRLLHELPERLADQIAAEPPETEYPQLSVTVTNLLDLGEGEAANTEHLGIREQIDAEMARQGQDFEDLHPIDRHLIGLMDALFDQESERCWSPDTLAGLLGKIALPALNLAVMDAAFLDREHHPARRLLNEVAALASGLEANGKTGVEPLHQKIDEVIERLRVIQNDTRGLTDLLAEFIEFAEKERRRSARLTARTMEEAVATERTNQAYEQVEKLLRVRVCGVERPLFVIDFVEQAWCKVLFLAHVKHGVESPQWRTAVHLLDQLVGLVTDSHSVESEYVERLVDTLATSLEHIAFDSFEASRLLRLVGDFFAADPVEASFHVLDKEEAREAERYFSLVATDTLNLAIPGEPQPVDDGLLAQLGDRDLSRVDSIALDSWVEFHNISGEPVRGRLLGVVPASNKFVFGDRAGNKVAEAHRYRLAVAMKEGNLVVLDNSHLFDEALTEAFEVMRKKAVNEG